MAFNRLHEDGALLGAGGRGRRALGRDEDAQVDEPGTCCISLADGSFSWYGIVSEGDLPELNSE
jgi:hypothetical protein